LGIEKVIAHPQEHAPLALSALRYGPILFLLAQAWYLRTVPRVSSLVHLIGSAALLALGFALTDRTGVPRLDDGSCKPRDSGGVRPKVTVTARINGSCASRFVP
jgi:hypothetical protein